jgi:hypothetical protein
MTQQMPQAATSWRQASRAARLIAERALFKLVAKIFAGPSQSALAKLELALAISVTTGIASQNRPFLILCSSKVQQRQRLRVQPPAELLERVAGGSRGDLGVDLHRDGDLAVPQDLHGHARVDIESHQQ